MIRLLCIIDSLSAVKLSDEIARVGKIKVTKLEREGLEGETLDYDCVLIIFQHDPPALELLSKIRQTGTPIMMYQLHSNSEKNLTYIAIRLTSSVRGTYLKKRIADPYKPIIEYMKLPLCIIHRGKIIFANTGVAELEGFSNPEELIDVSASELVIEEERNSFSKQLSLIMEGEISSHSGWYTHARTGGEKARIQTFAQAIEYEREYAVMLIARKAVPIKNAAPMINDLERRKSDLPEYPRVVVRNTAIIMIDEDLKETVWDYEEDEEEAEIIARDLEGGLRAIKHVKKQMTKNLNDLVEELISMDVPLDKVEEYIYEGSMEVINMMARMYRYKFGKDINER